MKARWILTAVFVGLATLVAFPVDSADRGGKKLVGTWRVAYRTPDGEESNTWLIEFHNDNTTTGSSDDFNFTTLHGVWAKTSGDDDDDDDNGNATFATTFEWFGGADSDGLATFGLRGRNTVHLDGDTISGTASGDVLSIDGTVVSDPILGFTFVGTRMMVRPE